MTGRISCHGTNRPRAFPLSIFFLICLLGMVDEAESKSLKNKAWLSQANKEAAIDLEINGRIVDLDRNIQTITEYYRQKPVDDFLLSFRGEAAKKESECARDLRRNTYRLRKIDPKVELPEDLTWSEDPYSDQNWEFWLHGWKFADCLMEGYEATGDHWYLDRLKWIVIDWWEDNFKPNYPSKKRSWYEHTIPMRLKKLTEIWEFVRRHKGLDESFVRTSIRLAYWHARILDEDAQIRVYSHNHGLDQAEYLFRASVIFPELTGSNQWRKNGLSRFHGEIRSMMSTEGVQVENSPAYHIVYGASAFRRMDFVEHYTGEPVFPALPLLENEALKFATVIAQPDGLLPPIGDTRPDQKLSINLPRLKSLQWYDHYLFVRSNGRRGEAPKSTRFIFPESGYYIYRDKWDLAGRNESTQLIMKCGLLGRGHRHDDDGGIVLYGLGEPWLTDAGIFGYGRKHPYRIYARSALAHNLSIPLGADTVRDPANASEYAKGQWGIVEYDPDSLSDIACSSFMYKGYLYKRRLQVVGPRSFRITDRVIVQGADLERRIATQFRVPQDRSIVVDEGEGRVEVTSVRGNSMVLLYDAASVKSVEIFSGETEQSLSLDTVAWREMTPVQTIRFQWAEDGEVAALSFDLSLIAPPTDPSPQ